MGTTFLKICAVYIGFLISCAVIAQPAIAAKKLLENWNSTPALDCSWRDGDIDRYVDTTDNKLHLAIRPYAASIDGDFCRDRARARFKDPASISSFTVTVNINKIEYKPEMLMTGAEVNGMFYKSTRAGDGATGDVQFKIRFGDRGSGLEVWWDMFESLNPDFTDEFKTTDVIVAPGTAGLATGNDYEITLEYDGDHTLSYSFAGGTINETGTATGPDHGDSPFYQGKALEARIYIDKPLITSPDINTLDVVYSDLYINGSATPYDTFTTPLNSTLWKEPDSAATVTANRLKMSVVSTTTDDQLIETLLPNRYGSSKFMQADIMLQGGLIPDGTRGETRMKNNWGNGKHTTEGDWDGSVATYSGIRKSNTTNEYQACCWTSMDDNTAVPDPWVDIFFNCVDASPDKFYTFSTERSGTVISCTIRDTASNAVLDHQTADTKDFGLATIYPVNQRKKLYTLLRKIPGPGRKEAIGYFDNVYIDDGITTVPPVSPARSISPAIRYLLLGNSMK
ncbi:MAG: hypothetical protein JRC87_10460 [Deltaproteobacteria bacterium]|nr:hypothetical protein [Deltaproteobacteria bacterium]